MQLNGGISNCRRLVETPATAGGSILMEELGDTPFIFPTTFWSYFHFRPWPLPLFDNLQGY